ncbi:NAD-dependent succinate-semialdehyde dehydrogenase [Streptomyces armeniacus]|uniref:NAD-dependent succinate-semialdehyde dehydrogenase n=1 Tax=Streptomyces armeniacus TaxID=83291 RepID=A0A345XPE1_9ACTN|nr:NAD-dependent succinate-semialdehyde dehydrogenase [Streptomyces armeniacus]AXK33507.1 NAD-dependent succinate-semialdehyde dehydrogenase [Streptomyces armeniacus]
MSTPNSTPHGTPYSAPTVLIDGAWHSRDERLAVHAPGTGALVGHVGFPDAGQAVRDASAACDAAARAFAGWSETTARYRADILLEAARLIRQRSGELAPLLAAEAGKRLPEAQGEIAFSAEYLRWFAEEARRTDGTVPPHEAAGRRHVVLRRPAGVVASLTPWNFPCSIQARKLAPALAAGCTVVARVSEKAPLAVTELIRCLTDAGLPDGVLNLVHGPAAPVTETVLDHPAVRVASFTGSTPVGKLIMEQCARRVVRPLLELGGDAPFVVLGDADVGAAVEGALLAKFRNTGQSCIAANRFLVHADVYDEFTEEFARRAGELTVGDGLAEPCPDLGPLMDPARVAAVRGLVDAARAEGATLLTAERPVPDDGCFLAPALLADVPPTAALASAEVFGPAAAVFRVADDAEALRLANATEMGLAAYVYARDLGRAWTFAERLEAGVVGVNEALPSVAFAPMGGNKQSGLGREGAADGLAEFTEPRYLSLGL